MAKLTPIEDNVVVETIEEEQTTKGGIVIPDSSKEKPQKGKVVAVGEGKVTDDGNRQPMEVKEGDVVYFTKYAPDEIEVEGTTYLVVKHSSILAKEN